MRICEECGGEIGVTQDKRSIYCNSGCRSENYIKRRREHNWVYQERVKGPGIRYKNDLKEKCKMCGYNKSKSALCFHHPGSKGRALSKIHKIDEIKAEIEKHPIEVLCMNCHAIFHNSA